MTTGRSIRSLHNDRLMQLEIPKTTTNKPNLNLDDPYDPPNDYDVATVGFVKRTFSLKSSSETSQQLLNTTLMFSQGVNTETSIRFFPSGIMLPHSCSISKIGIMLPDNNYNYSLKCILNNTKELCILKSISSSGITKIDPPVSIKENNNVYFLLEPVASNKKDTDVDIDVESSLTLYIQLTA